MHSKILYHLMWLQLVWWLRLEEGECIRNWVNPQSTYICIVQSFVWPLPKYWPPHPLSTQRSVCPPPAPKRRAVRGWGNDILEEARHWIGILQYR
jgi:hypothetical protein